MIAWLTRLPRKSPTKSPRLVRATNDGNSEYVLDHTPAIIGRDSLADIVVSNCWASRRHCQIDEIDGVLTVRDLGSRNGTFVNRRPIKESTLRPGDVISVGLDEFTVAMPSDARSAAVTNQTTLTSSESPTDATICS